MCCRYPIQVLLTSGNGIAYKNNSYAFLTFPCNSVEYPQRLTAYSSVSRLRLSELRTQHCIIPPATARALFPPLVISLAFAWFLFTCPGSIMRRK